MSSGERRRMIVAVRMSEQICIQCLAKLEQRRQRRSHQRRQTVPDLRGSDGKARSPIVLCFDRGTWSSAVDAERSRLRELMSATRYIYKYIYIYIILIVTQLSRDLSIGLTDHGWNDVSCCFWTRWCHEAALYITCHYGYTVTSTRMQPLSGVQLTEPGGIDIDESSTRVSVVELKPGPDDVRGKCVIIGSSASLLNEQKQLRALLWLVGLKRGWQRMSVLSEIVSRNLAVIGIKLIENDIIHKLLYPNYGMSKSTRVLFYELNDAKTRLLIMHCIICNND